MEAWLYNVMACHACMRKLCSTNQSAHASVLPDKEDILFQQYTKGRFEPAAVLA